MGARMSPRVSIVTTVFDRVACLARCLRSVQHLAFTDVEQIVVSDAPPTAVLREIEALVAGAAAAGTRVRSYNLPHRTNNWGIGPPLMGFRESAGEFVCFLSDDNAYLPEHFGPLIKALDADPDLGFVYSSCEYAGRKRLDAPTPAVCRIDLGQPLFRRSVLTEHFREDFSAIEFAWDWRLIERIMAAGVRWQHIDIPSFIFRLDCYPEYMRALA